jgi:TLD
MVAKQKVYTPLQSNQVCSFTSTQENIIIIISHIDFIIPHIDFIISHIDFIISHIDFRDGFKAQDFHTHCDNKGPTITIIRSHPKNYLFGGYSSLPWTNDASQGSYRSDANAFVYTLTNPLNIPQTKYAVQSTRVQYAVCHQSNYGPTFGAGHDINVADESNNNTTSYTVFGNSFNDTTGKGSNTLVGELHFTTNEIEVHLVSDI